MNNQTIPNTGIHNTKSYESLFINRTDIHGVYRYYGPDTHWFEQLGIYDSTERVARHEFYTQEAMDSKESINLFDLFIPYGVDLNDYDGTIVVGRRKNTGKYKYLNLEEYISLCLLVHSN